MPLEGLSVHADRKAYPDPARSFLCVARQTAKGDDRMKDTQSRTPIQRLAIDTLQPFKNHPFRMYEGECK